MSTLAASKQPKKKMAGGYKALVMIFLAGGNDGNNTVVPLHSSSGGGSYSTYGDYASARGVDLRIPETELLEITVARMGSRNFGLHPSLGPAVNGNAGIASLFGDAFNSVYHRKLAIVTNVGTLVDPIANKTEFDLSQTRKPYQLFSHSDQIDQNQSGKAGEVFYTGWGGRLGDRFTPAGLPTGISIAGSQLFLAGNGAPLAVGDASTPLGSLFKLDPDVYPAERRAVIEALIAEDVQAGNKFVRTAADAAKLAALVNEELESAPVYDPSFPVTGIGQQLKQVAKLIKFSSESESLDISRQVYCCVLGGFDTHANQLGTQSYLLSQLGQAMRAFFEEMVTLNISEKVTTFTQSDFGRTLDPTGSGASVGSDHAWGNHLFVLGGAVNGGDFYGFDTDNGTPFPLLLKGGYQDTDSRGRWIPSTSIDQYGANLAKWFGVANGDLHHVFPNIANFGNDIDLGFI